MRGSSAASRSFSTAISGGGDVGIAEAEVDHVLARAPQLELQPLDLGEGIRRQGVDPAKVRHAADRRKAPSASRTATTSPITTSAGVGQSAAAAPIAPSGATTTCSSSVVPHETTAAGVDAGFPSRDQPLGEPPDDRAAHEGDERARDAGKAAASSSSTSFAANAVTACETPRCVTGMPTDSGHRRDRRDAGDELERHAGVGERERLLPAAAEDERVAALQPHDAAAPPPVRDEQLVDRRPARSRRARCAASRRRLGDELLCDEPVVDEHLAARARARARAR